MNIENSITNNQWNKLVWAVKRHVASEPEINDDRIYVYESKRQTGIYDNYDYCYSPGLIFSKGMLYAWSNSEQHKAPITFNTGMTIAENFFNDTGVHTAESIVCDYVMDNNL